MNSIDLILFQPYFLAFGFGSNFPVGLALAKIQTKDVSARLLNNIPDITLETLANAPGPFLRALPVGVGSGEWR